jgi:ElaA protein
MINRLIKHFSELTTTQLYQILALRIEVFVVEQECIYQDLDHKDQKAIHVLGIDVNDKLVSYARILPPGVIYPEFAIGRVIVAHSHRGTGEGHRLMTYAMELIESMESKSTIRISAQAHLEKFYEAHHFESTGKTYLEDGIPHLEMIYYPKLAL